MKTILLFTLVILTIAISGCQDKKKTKDTKTQKEAVNVENKAVFIKDTIPTTETVTENTAVKEAPEYFLIGGCFRIKDNADRMYDNLHKEGYTNEKEAITAVRKIHEIPGKEETWIYQIK